MSAAAAVLTAFTTNHRIHGETATYRVGEQSIASLDVIPGQSEAEAIGDSGLVTTVDVQDFLVRASDLRIGNGPPFTPDRGHLIEVVRDGQVHSFAVSHPDASRAPFRRSDAYGKVLRIHTAEVQASETVAE